jgi:DNA transformation protein
MSDDAIGVWLVEAWTRLGTVKVRRMFGGAGVSIDGLSVGLLAEGELYLKVDGHSRPEFEERGLAPFIYHKDGKPYAMSYHRAPAELFDDPEEALIWGQRALQAARRAATSKPRVKRL